MDNRLDVYIHDYLVKRDLKASAQAFQAEGKVSFDPVGLQLLTPLKVFSLSGGQYFGIYLLLELMRSTQRLLHLTLRVWLKTYAKDTRKQLKKEETIPT